MNIVIPILGFGRTGGYRVISKLATAWTLMGHNVEIFVNHSSAQPYFPTDGTIRWLDDCGRNVESSAHEKLKGRRGVELVRKNLCSLSSGLRRYASSSHIVLANHSLTAWPVALARAGSKRFYYVQAYEPEYYQLSRGTRAKILRLISSLSYFLPLERVVNSPIYFAYKNLRARFFVPPGIDLTIYHPKQTTGASVLSPAILGCIGRSEPDKGIQYVIEAYKELLARRSRVQLRIAYGNVPPETFGLPGVSLIVPKDDKELSEFYRSIDVLIAPGTVQHGAPHYPVMEAMACGSSVITTGYLPADETNAWIVTNRSYRAIADAVEALTQDHMNRELKISRGLSTVQKYSWPVVAAGMLNIFEQGLAEASRN